MPGVDCSTAAGNRYTVKARFGDDIETGGVMIIDREDGVRLCCGGFVVSDSKHRHGTRLAPHRHPFACVHFALEGCYEEVVDGSPVRLRPGETLVKRAGVEHSNDFGTAGARTLRVEIHRDVGDLDRLLRASRRAAVTRDTPELRVLAARLRGRLGETRRTRELAAEGLCLQLVATLLEEPAPEMTELDDLPRRALDLLGRTFRSKRSLAAIAATLQVDASRLSRLVRRATGRTLGEHQRELRVRWVAERLRESRHTVGSLSLAAGFADQSHCVRVFRRVTGLTPSAYRDAAVQGVQGGKPF
jgi:AraC-like DNA-binding protein/mannose-6-phosphate isomerase-like protein (cupin superfamily)